MGFAVLLNEMVPLPLDKVAPIIAKAEHIVLADATRALRNSTGFLVKNLLQSEAEMIAAELNSIGIGCFVLDDTTMYHPPEYILVNTALVKEDGFYAIDLYGNTAVFDWRNLIFISIGKIMPHKAERYNLGSDNSGETFRQAARASFTLATGIPMSFGETVPQKKPAEMTKARFVLDLFFKSPQEAHFRIYGDGFNYGYLGSRLSLSSSQNFRFLVEDIVHSAPHSYGNKGLDSFLGRGAQKNTEYPDMKIFDEENLWMLQIVWINLQH